MRKNKSSINGQSYEIENFIISVILNVRRQKRDGQYPLELYVYHKGTFKKKIYGTKLAFEIAEFESLFNKDKAKLKKSQREVRDSIEDLVKKTCGDLETFQGESFDFEQFETKLFRKTSDSKNVYWFYDQRISHFSTIGSIGNASWYKHSKASLKAFQTTYHKSNQNLSFEEISTNWLQKYESYMLNLGRSRTTVSIYLRALRAVFNEAIKTRDIDKSYYPFGERKFNIKEGGKVKKALSVEDLKMLFSAEPSSPDQQKARDFWMFSYLSNGMNVKDILFLKYGQLLDDKFQFERVKTSKTIRKSKIIEVYLSAFHWKVIDKYGNPDKTPKNLVFPTLTLKSSPEEIYSRTKAFTRYINQHIKKLAKAIGITPEISTYFARHSYATNLIRQGNSIAFVQESLGHSSIKTTERYFAGFTDASKKESAIQIFNQLIE